MTFEVQTKNDSLSWSVADTPMVVVKRCRRVRKAPSKSAPNEANGLGGAEEESEVLVKARLVSSWGRCLVEALNSWFGTRRSWVASVD